MCASRPCTRQRLVAKRVAPDKVRLVPHGVECDRFSPAPDAGLRPFRFVYAGLIDARKGVPLLLQAWRELKAPDAELWLVGPATPASPCGPGAARECKAGGGMLALGSGINTMRNKLGTGHGRPWLPNITDTEARAAIQFMGTIAEWMLHAHARKKIP